MMQYLLFGNISGGGNSALAPPSYPGTLLDLINDVLSRLHLPQDTPAGQFNNGNGNLIVTTTNATITQYLNDAIGDICRRGYPFYGERTFTAGAATAGSRSAGVCAFTDMSPGTGARVWAVNAAAWNGAELTHTSFSALKLWKTDYLTAQGTPAFWYEQGTAAIGLYPAPALAGSLWVSGLAIPAQLVNSTDVCPLAPDLQTLAVFHACSRLTEKASDNPDLLARAAIWAQAYEQGVQAQLWGLWMDDPDLARKHFGQPSQQGGPLNGIQTSMGASQQGQG